MIYEVNVNTGATGAVIKNGTYSGNSPSSANGLGYNFINGKFYYFKRNVTRSPQEFVSFNPLTNTVSILASSAATNDIHTGCVNHDGTGYYTVDVDGNLHYYKIATNTWTKITGTIVDQYGNDVDLVIRNQNAGDMAIDGYGHIWLLTASNSNYALYKFPVPMPTTAQASITVTQVIPPTTSTPTGKSFAGIAFSPTGQIYMATKSGNKFYKMNDDHSFTFIGNLGTSDVGNDLTSCNFPMGILPVTWVSFNASVQGSKMVKLDWEVAQENNKGFYVQYSVNGENWQDVAFVAAKNGALQSYSYTHINQLSGKQYYRVKQVDMNDKESYSPIKTVTLNNEKQTISIWPNPATDQVRIQNNGNTIFSKAQVFDLSGRMVSEKRLDPSGINTISVSSLPKGIYIVKVQGSDGTSYNEKINKQ